MAKGVLRFTHILTYLFFLVTQKPAEGKVEPHTKNPIPQYTIKPIAKSTKGGGNMILYISHPQILGWEKEQVHA